MNLKLVLAAALFVSTGTFVAQAQHKTTVSKATATSSAAKAFQTKVNAFKAETDANKALLEFRALSTDMSDDLAKAKSGIAAANTDADKKTAMDKYTAKQTAMTEAMRLFKATSPNENKDAVVASLNKFGKTL